jgi:general secretion pathway protein K
MRLPAATRTLSRGDSGFALLVVVWFLVLLAAIGVYMIANARSEIALAHNLLASAQAEALADGAIALAAYSQMTPDPGKRWKLDETAHRLDMPGGDVTIQLINESAKINPNLASAAILSGLFQAVGVDRARADNLSRAVGDWVQAGDNPGALNAKAQQYLQAGRSYAPPGTPLQSLDDLQLVLGMTPQIFAAARPYLTIFTDADAPKDRKLMSPAVARAMEIAASAGGGPAVAGDNTATSQQPPSSEVVTIRATARGRDGGIFVRQAVLSIAPDTLKEPDNINGYLVLDWRRGVIQAGTASR